ncbi:hypothetical protein Pla110_39750 [Polystyrenella longa]|uniref:Uncharacterized protein n=1 Tax=Polystyrenella longa TaxID=2528007 RepID=A0A518CSN0_9PLAN|nr:hypothetical protein [Polystyrenella longa]QDU82220.1 hypothetical protein Pla110_39750 [Polystyrenella longa]
MTEEKNLLETLINEEVVIDARSEYVFIGRMMAYDEHYLVLKQADVHDMRDSSTTREMYVLEAKRHGYPWNRERVFIRREEAISISKLDDVRE